MASTNKFPPHIITAVLLVLFGGPSGVVAVVYDYLKQGDYSPAPPPEKKIIIKQLGLAVIFLLLANSVLSGLTLDLVIPGLGTLNAWLPAFAQGLVGLIIVQRYLHKYNLYFTNRTMWQSVDWSTTLTELSKAELTDIIKNPSTAPKSATTSSPTQMSASSPYKFSQIAIVVDQSGDAWRTKLIIWAALIGLLILGYQYLAKNPEVFFERVNQVMEEYLEAENL